MTQGRSKGPFDSFYPVMCMYLILCLTACTYLEVILLLRDVPKGGGSPFPLKENMENMVSIENRMRLRYQEYII